MADEEHEESAIPDVEHDVPADAPAPEDLPPAEPITDEGPPPLPLEPAEPGLYWCEHESPGRHPVLGGLVEGENDFSYLTTDEEKLALAALVQAGVLEKIDKPQAPAEPKA